MVAMRLGAVLCALALVSAEEGRQQAKGVSLRVAQTPAPEPLQRARALFKGSQGVVCGGPQIRDLLSQGSGTESVRTLPWSSALAVATEYLSRQASLIARLEAEAERLRKAIPEAKKAEEPKPITAEQVRLLINSALVAPGSFGSLEAALNSECGYKRTKPKTGNGAFRKAGEAFQKAATAMLEGGNIRASGPLVFRYCSGVLPVGNASDLTHGYCTELCHDFADYAKDASDKVVGGLALNSLTSAELEKELAQKMDQIKYEQQQANDCRIAQTDLEAFRQQLEIFERNVREEHEKLRAANDKVNDEKEELDTLQKDIIQQATSLENAVKTLLENSNIREGADRSLQAAKDTVAAAQTAKATAENVLAAAETKVKNLEGAALVAGSIKDAVSTVLRNMHAYFEAAVRKPLRTIGLGETVDLQKAFAAPAALLAEAAAAKKSLQDFDSFCKDGSTIRAFQALAAPDIDIASLCQFGDIKQVHKEIDGAVQTRIESLRQGLTKVQKSTLDVYHGQGDMNEEKAKLLRSQGEPAGLREVISSFSQTEFYRSYLTHWKVAEKYQLLFAKLTQATSTAIAEKNIAQQNLQKRKDELAEAELKRSQAEAALAAASDAEGRAKASKEQNEAQLRQLQAQKSDKQTSLARLEEAARAAAAAYNAAIKVLQDTHRHGIGLVQLFQELSRAARAAA